MSRPERGARAWQPRERLPLRRPRTGRWFGGVCAGLAAHLGFPVGVIRLVFAVLAPAGGAGIAGYILLWVTVPAGDPEAVAKESRPVSESRIAPRLRRHRVAERFSTRSIVLGAALLAAAAVLIAVRLGADVRISWVLPALIALGGVALAWSQLDAVQRGQLLTTAGGSTRSGLLRLAGGILIVLVGVILFIGQGTPWSVVWQIALGALAVLVGAAIVMAPWWLRMVRELDDERVARAREAERADIAAHLHDSVLQTLALIRAQAGDADAVARLARAQERELRAWLYDDRSAAGTSLAAQIKELVGEVEDGRIGRSKSADGLPAPVAIDTVVVGDCEPTKETAALVQATREALVNAVAHGRPPISLYLEVAADSVQVFVRDRGDGFDPEAIAADRFGVRESILGRVRRRGGTAEVVSRAGWGTEIRLRVPRSTPADAAEADPAGADGPDRPGRRQEKNA